MKSFLSGIQVHLIAATLLILVIAGCNDKITYVPVIESISVTPDTVVVGGSAMIEIVATDADDEELVFYYTTTGGSISGVGDTVSWTAPNKEGIYTTKVLVTDKDGNQANDSIQLVVVRNDTTSQITGVAAFPSGIDFDLINSKVRLFTSKTNWVNHVVFAETPTEGFGPIVSFTFDNVPVGTYYLEIWKDTDFGNTLNAGDFYGWYGTGDILHPSPEPFTLESGATKVMQIQIWVVPE
ncbi:MAG: hypothetical protein JZU53_18590 [Paludibacter sp.]|nr:hypothetical protein [Paludibacter sp.]